MSTYAERAEETSFTSLIEDDEFKADLVKFFTGGRYQYSREDLLDRGFDGLAKDFVEHMRYQSWNEVEAVRDLTYVNNKDYDVRGKEAFARLMQAYDVSDSAGVGIGQGAVGDFAGAIFSAPSTYLGLGSFGVGKLAAKGATKATQLGVRYGLKDYLKKNVVKTGVQRAGSQSIKKQALKEGAIGFTTGAAIGGGQAIVQGETREDAFDIAGIDGYDYTTKDAIFDVAVSGLTEGALGGVLGYGSGLFGRKNRAKADSILSKRKVVVEKKRKQDALKAVNTIKSASESQKKAAMKNISDLEEVLSARAGVKSARLRGALDPERVAKGRAILNSITNPDVDPIFASGLSADTMRKVAAASIDLMNSGKLRINDNERITQGIADAIRNDETGEIFGILETVRDKYGLSKDEFSLIYLSEVSRAGQTLGYASAIKRGANLAGLDTLYQKGASSINSEEMANISKEAILKGSGKGDKTFSFFQDLDAMRIAFMTSQPVTTMRNLRNTGIVISLDIIDQTNRAIYKKITGDLDPKDVKDFIPNATAMLRGFTLNNAEAKVVREILLEESPERYKRLYNNAMRIDVGLEGQSAMAGAGRFVNTFNTATDSILKEGIFYGELDRQLRQKGTTLKEWLQKNDTLERLPEGVNVDSAVEVANRFTMQRTFREDDSLLARGTKAMVDLNRKLPFLISEGVGVPFPRYVGNHLQTIGEYTPFLGELMQTKGIIAKEEDASLRAARQMTGLMLIGAGISLAQLRNGEADYGSLRNTIANSPGMTEDMKPWLGSSLMHMYVGDLVWRYSNGLPLDVNLRELREVFGGIPEFSFDLAIGTELIKAIGSGDTEDFEKELGTVLSTFSYPFTIARDVYAQLDPNARGSAYVRDLAMQDNVNPKLRPSTGIFLNQSTRMLMDTSMVQYTQSFNGENDIKYYRFSNPNAIGTINPVIKQITGSPDEPPLTGLEQEMNKFKIKDFEIYNKRTVPNASVDLILRRFLAKGDEKQGIPSLAIEFESWRTKASAAPKRHGNLSYNEIMESEQISGKEKKEILEGFIQDRIRQRKDVVENMFEAYSKTKPVSVRGYIRNQFDVLLDQRGKKDFDLVAKRLGYPSAAAMIQSSDSVEDEMRKRLSIMGAVNNLEPM